MYTPSAYPIQGRCNKETDISVFCSFPLATGNCPDHPGSTQIPAAPAPRASGLTLDELSPSAQRSALAAVAAQLPRDAELLVSSALTTYLASHGITGVSTFVSTEATPEALDPSTPSWIRIAGRIDTTHLRSRGISDRALAPQGLPSVIVPDASRPWEVEFHVEVSEDNTPSLSFSLAWAGDPSYVLAAQFEAETTQGRHMQSFLTAVALRARYEVEYARFLISTGNAALSFIRTHRLLFTPEGSII